MSFLVVDLGGRHSKVGSLAGTTYLLKDNAGVLRRAQCEQKSHVEQKEHSLTLDFHYD